MKYNIFRPLSREAKINILVFVILIGFVGAAIYHNIIGSYFHKGYPYNTFLFRPEDRFYDFVNLFNLAHNGNPYFEPYNPLMIRNIFPFLFFISFLIQFLDVQTALWGLIILFLGFFLFITYRNIKTGNLAADLQKVLIISFMTYPVLFALDRANPEILIFILLYLCVNLHHQKKYLASALFFAFALAQKPFPAGFLLLFISVKKFKEIFIIAILLIILTFAPLAIFQGGISGNLNQLLFNLNHYNQEYMTKAEYIAFGHSLFGLLRFLLISYTSIFAFIAVKIYKFYFWSSFIVMLLLSIYILYIEKEFWKKIALLVFSMNILPFVSADYKLLHIFIPLFLFINKKEADKYDLVYVILFSLLLIPKNYYNFMLPSIIPAPEANPGIILNPLIMLAMSALIIMNGLKDFKLKLSASDLHSISPFYKFLHRPRSSFQDKPFGPPRRCL